MAEEDSYSRYLRDGDDDNGDELPSIEDILRNAKPKSGQNCNHI